MAIVKPQSTVGEVKFFPKKVVKLATIAPPKKTLPPPKKTSPSLPEKTRAAILKAETTPLTSRAKAVKMDMWTGLLAFSLLATTAYLIAEKGE